MTTVKTYDPADADKLTLTAAAAEHVRNEIKKRGKGVGLRLSIKESGCSGYAYVVDIAEEINDADDFVFGDRSDNQAVLLIVDQQAFPLVKGSTIDFVKKGLNQVFEVFFNFLILSQCLGLKSCGNIAE